jgi:hypothetical protein
MLVWYGKLSVLDLTIIPSACKLSNNFVCPAEKAAHCRDGPSILYAMKPVSYLDILRRTKKNNCGECGHPTCMAFAVVVAKTGGDPILCPYIDLAGLTLPEAAADNLSELARKRDLALIKHLKTKIMPLDFAALTEPLGADCSADQDDTLVFSYLGQKVTFSKDTILLGGAEPEDPRDQILLYNYVASGGGRRPDNNWIGLESLPNSISKVKTLETYCENRLADLFTGWETDRILDLGRKLDGVPEPDTAASLGVIIPVLPMVPQYLLFWDHEPADGFAARVKLLFDQHVLDYLDLESLVFSAERLADRFEEFL